VTAVARDALRAKVERALRSAPVVFVLGPRQCGKTTLVRLVAEARRATSFDLERPTDADRLREPMTALEPLRGTVVIDEAQLSPQLFPVLRVLSDRRPLPARFVLTGSASPELGGRISESLAGRVAIVPMAGFDLWEVGAARQRRLWWRGGFPRSFLARSDAASDAWRSDFIQTFLERDIPRLGVRVPPGTLRRFWMMIAHHHGGIWNASEIGRSLGEAHTTIRHHLDVLTDAFVMRQLPPWFQNIAKRQVKSPKVYLRDSGLLHSLLGLPSFAALEGHPKLGASWEGFALEHVLHLTGDRQAYFWATPSGAELDLLVFLGGKRYGFELKYADAPCVTKSLRVALEDLGLERAFIVHPGAASYPVGDRVEVLALAEVRDRLSAVERRR
jgi:predicted AAA+ superfamily ATPase